MDEYPEAFDVPYCHELLGDSYRREDRLEDAERHYRSCLRLMPESRSGTSGLCDLSLAELLTERGDEASLAEAIAILRRIRDDARRRLVLNAQIFRFLLAWTRLTVRLGETDAAAEAARQALSIAARTKPQFPRHPTIGLVDADEETMAELRRLARAR